MTVSENDVYRTLVETIVMSEEEDRVYIYSFVTGKEFGTNETGKEILELCNNKQVKEIAGVLAKKYREDQNTVLHDVKRFLEEALRESLVERVVKNEK